MSILPAILPSPLNHIRRTISSAWFFVPFILKGPYHIPVCFRLGPAWFSMGSTGFAFVMRFESQDPTMGFEGTCACAIGTFHEINTTLPKTLEINGNQDPRKRAFGRFGRLLLVHHRIVTSRKRGSCGGSLVFLVRL